MDDGNNSSITTGMYRSEAMGPARGTVLVAHEIFGLTPHIRSVCDRLAAAGYTAIAPDLFAEKLGGGILPYTDEGKQRGVAIKNGIGEERLAAHLQECIPVHGSKVAVIGFCLGGTLAWMSATHPRVACVVAYYGVGLLRHPRTTTHAPVLMHFGRTDRSIPIEDVEIFRNRQPEVEIHAYGAGHAFNRDDDHAFQPEPAKLAWTRTIDFLAKYLPDSP